jgi:S1-C subfamily serine protease
MFSQSLLYLATAAMFFPAPREPAPDDKGRGFFGVQLVDNGGVSITRVEPGSPADKAGIQPTDQILAIDTQKIPNVNEAREIIGRLRPGMVARVEVRRGEKSMTIKVKVGIRPETIP